MSQPNGKPRKLHFDDPLEIAIAADKETNSIIIRFGAKIRWLSIEKEKAEQLRDFLNLRISELE